MARVAVVAFGLLLLVCAAYAQQQVQCTFQEQGRTSRRLDGTSFTGRSGVTFCWELDNLAGDISGSETRAPVSPELRITASADGANTQVTKQNTVCTTGSNDLSVYGTVRELSLTGRAARQGISSTVDTYLAFSSDAAENPGTLVYRLDGQGSCASNTFSSDFNLRTKTGKSLNDLGDAFELLVSSDLSADVTIRVFGSSASESASITIRHNGSGSSAIGNAVNYVIFFSEFQGSQNAFTNTGAIEIQTGSGDLDIKIFFFDVIPRVVVNTQISGKVFEDCGCNGFQTGDRVIANQNVNVAIGGSGAGCTGSRTATTNANGDFSVTALPSPGCSFTVTVPGLSGLCSNTPSSQVIGDNGVANFAVQGTASAISCPPPRSVPCGADTSVTALGGAQLSAGTCGGSGGTATNTDSIAEAATCTPGGTIRTITRTFTSGSQTCTQIITVTDARVVSFSNVPAASTLPCNTQPTGTATATSCSGGVTVTATNGNAATGTCDVNTCSRSSSVARTYTAKDKCGNTATQTVTYTLTGCSSSCTPAPTPSTPPSPPPTDLPDNANCRFICDDDDSSATTLAVSVLVSLVLALLAAF